MFLFSNPGDKVLILVENQWTQDLKVCHKQFFFVNSEYLGIRIWQKKLWKLQQQKIKRRQVCADHIFLLAGATWYYHGIYMVFTTFFII